MLEHYSHIRLSAKEAALDRLDATTRGTPIKSAKWIPVWPTRLRLVPHFANAPHDSCGQYCREVLPDRSHLSPLLRGVCLEISQR
jgi:hypothetical protein